MKKSINLLEYTSGFELKRSTVIGPIKHKTKLRFRNSDNFESYINAIVNDYDSEDFTFTGYVFKLKTPQFNIVNRSV